MLRTGTVHRVKTQYMIRSLRDHCKNCSDGYNIYGISLRVRKDERGLEFCVGKSGIVPQEQGLDPKTSPSVNIFQYLI